MQALAVLFLPPPPCLCSLLVSLQQHSAHVGHSSLHAAMEHVILPLLQGRPRPQHISAQALVTAAGNKHAMQTCLEVFNTVLGAAYLFELLFCHTGSPVHVVAVQPLLQGTWRTPAGHLRSRASSSPQILHDANSITHPTRKGGSRRQNVCAGSAGSSKPLADDHQRAYPGMNKTFCVHKIDSTCLLAV